MPLASLLLLSMVMVAPASQTPAIQPHGPDQSADFLSQSGALPAQSFELSPLAPMPDSAVTPSDDICYKIRAYIFKRDDDHAPEFVRSTTCGPRKPHTKSIDEPTFRLVPAN